MLKNATNSRRVTIPTVFRPIGGGDIESFTVKETGTTLHGHIKEQMGFSRKRWRGYAKPAVHSKKRRDYIEIIAGVLSLSWDCKEESGLFWVWFGLVMRAEDLSGVELCMENQMCGSGGNEVAAGLRKRMLNR